MMIQDWHHRQGRRMAPSRRQVVPVAQGFSMMACESLANSSDWPSLPQGTWLIMWSRAFFCSPSPMGVWNTPGAIAITLILYFPRSLARGRTMALTAPLVAAQMTCPRCPSYPATLLTTTMTPRSPSTSGCSDISLAANLATLKVPITLILSRRSISEVEATPFEQMMVPAVTTPAQWTTPDTFPKVFLVNQNNSRTLSSLETSTLKKGAFSC